MILYGESIRSIYFMYVSIIRILIELNHNIKLKTNVKKNMPMSSLGSLLQWAYEKGLWATSWALVGVVYGQNLNIGQTFDGHEWAYEIVNNYIVANRKKSGDFTFTLKRTIVSIWNVTLNHPITRITGISIWAHETLALKSNKVLWVLKFRLTPTKHPRIRYKLPAPKIKVI